MDIKTKAQVIVDGHLSRVCISYETFLEWKNICSQEIYSTLSFTDLLNYSVSPSVQFTATSRLNSRLQKWYYNALQALKCAKGGRQRTQLLKRKSVISIEPEELLNVNYVLAEKDEWKARCEKLYDELAEARKISSEKTEEVINLQKQLDDLKKQNKVLYDYVQKLSAKIGYEYPLHDVMDKAYKGVTGVGPRQLQRRLKKIETFM